MNPETFTSADGLVLAYSIVGTGPWALLLAGGPGLSVETLAPIVVELSKSRTCVLLHQRGTGMSQIPQGVTAPFDIPSSVSDIEVLRAHLGISKWTVFGHSYGSLLGLAYAASHPTAISSMFLVGPCGLDMSAFPAYMARMQAKLSPSDLAAFQHWSSPEEMAADPNQAVLDQYKILATQVFYNPANVAPFQASLPHIFTPSTFLGTLGVLMTANLNLRPKLSVLAFPVQVVQGKQDLLGPDAADSVQSAFPTSTLTLIDQACHFPWIDQPGPFFTALMDFCTKTEIRI